MGLILVGALLVPVWHYRIEAVRKAAMVDPSASTA